MPEHRKVKKDRGYTLEEIAKMLQFCDERTRVIVLLLASTGMRVGAIPELKLKHLEKMENDIYKVTVYENSPEQYITFTTPECSKAIDSYTDMRSRYGEKLEDECFLIREQFDIKDKLAISKCRSISRETIQWKLREITQRSNVKSKQTPNAHGFRKFFATQLVEADLNTEKRWKLEGQNLKANDPSYVGITEKRLIQEYQKAINNLTINEENRLKLKVQALEDESNEIQNLKKQLCKHGYAKEVRGFTRLGF